MLDIQIQHWENAIPLICIDKIPKSELPHMMWDADDSEAEKQSEPATLHLHAKPLLHL